jgi:hypothetical protein
MKLTVPPRFIARSARRLAIAFFCAATVASLVAQSPFDPALERDLWKTLLPMGGDLAIAGPSFVPVPRRTSINTPSPIKIYSWTDEYGDDIYVSTTVPSSMPGATQEEQAENAYNAEVDLLRDGAGSLAGNEGACTFSHRDDWDGDGPQWRQCVTGGRMLPPPPGALLDPVGLAVDGTTVYVVDDMNQRVQAFDFQGRVKPMKYPIGNGVPGSGTYSYSGYLPYASFPGYETFDGGYSGSQLKGPNGIAVDAAHQLAIADSGNHRIAVFANDGASIFSFPLPEQLGRAMKPTLVAATPGATFLPPGSTIPAGRENDRIVVTDWSHCMVQIYRSNFELVKTLPEALPASAMHDACKNGDPTVAYPNGTPTFDGEFSTVTGLTIDQAGHIYVTDHAQNAVQVFDVDGNTLGWIGKPGVQPAPGEILGPVGVAIDHLGRVGVIDAGNSRVVFYSVTYSPSNVPTATFEFQLDTVVSVSDFPMGLAEQWGSTADGLDPKGRFVATDPWGKQILRFELPELGIVDAQAAMLPVQPAGQPADQLTGRGTFKVAVPRQKDGAVIDVETFVVPVEAGVSVVPGSIVPGNDQVPTIDIGAGQYVAYEFAYTMGASVTQATFTITARGDFDGTTWLAEAPEAKARSRAACTGCDATHEIYWLDQDASPGLATPITNPATGAWYPAGVSVRLLPVPADGSISHIGWYYDGASEIFYSQHGTTQESPLGPDGHVEVPVGVEGVTRLTYWAITTEGSVGDPHTVALNVDLTNPSTNFLIWPPFTGTGDSAGRRWYNHDVTVGYVATDIHSGTDQDTQSNPAVADGQLFFTAEGRDQSQDVIITDRVGYAATFNSASSSGGRLVNIDKVAPVFDSVPADPIVLMVNGDDAQGSYVTVHPNAFMMTASDPNLSNGQPGSGVASVTNPGNHVFRYGVANTWTYTATDHAGNSTSITVNVMIQQRPTEIGAPDRIVGYGGRLVLRAAVTPRSATGTVTFSFGPHTIVAPLQTTSGGIDPATGVERIAGEAVAVLDPVMDNVGSYPLTVAYSGDSQNVSVSSNIAKVDVLPRSVTISADPKKKYLGDVDPALTYSLSGLLGSDTATVSLSRTPGDALGAYAILLNSATVGPNYAVVYQGANLAIVGRVTVTPLAKTMTYGDAEGAYPFSLSALPEGVVIGTQPVCGVAVAHTQFGQYAITCSGGNGSFVEFIYGTASLSVEKRAATLIAGSGSKSFGAIDPPLATTHAGILAADVAGITLTTTRAAGTAIGDYATTATATGGASNNYAFTVTPGVFSIVPSSLVMTLTGGTFTYDGVAHPATCTVADVLGLQLPSVVTYAPGGAIAPRNAGTYTATCSFLGDLNYGPLTNTATVTINKKAATLIAASTSRPYATANPVFTASAGGVIAGDTLNYTLTSPALVTSPAGAYDINVNLLSNPNYTITTTKGTLTVTRRPLTITATAATKVYGNADPSLLYTVTGSLATGDTLSGSLVRAAGANAGTYAIGIGSLTAGGNYAITFKPANFTITKRDATVTAQDKSKIFGQADPPLTATGSGFLSSDAITLSATRAAGTAVGTYVITPSVSGAAAGNYNVTLVKGVFTIITDNRPPVCSAVTGGEIWPPNHKKFYAAPIKGVTDPEGQAITILITGIWQDELIDSTGDGKFSPDGQGVGTSAAWVRAERNGHQNKATGNGRVYEILFKATDSKGASCSGSVIWTVPHDQGQGSTAIDSGVRYDSTGIIPGARDKSQIHQNSPKP